MSVNSRNQASWSLRSALAGVALLLCACASRQAPPPYDIPEVPSEELMFSGSKGSGPAEPLPEAKAATLDLSMEGGAVTCDLFNAPLEQVLSRLDELTPEPQPDTGVTYAEKIDKAEARIDWSRPAREVDWHIRGLSPFPGAWCEIGGERVKVLTSRVEDGMGPAGTVLDDTLLIACGDGAVRLTRLQRAGKGVANADVFLNGYPVSAGTVLSGG